MKPKLASKKESARLLTIAARDHWCMAAGCLIPKVRRKKFVFHAARAVELMENALELSR